MRTASCCLVFGLICNLADAQEEISEPAPIIGADAAANGQAPLVNLQPRTPLTKRPGLMRPQSPHRLVVKFRDDLKVRPDAGRPASRAGKDLAAVRAVVQQFDARLHPLIDLPQATLDAIERRASQNSGVAQPDLGGMFFVTAKNDAGLLELANALNALAEVEFVYFEDLEPPPPCADIAPASADFTDQQDYRGPNPGVNVLAANSLGNAGGAGIRVADCEFGFNPGHEDLCNITTESGQTPNSSRPNDFEHGTAVFGEIIGRSNTYGVTGIAPFATGLFFPEQTTEGGSRRVTAITSAIANVAVGDVVVLEMQTGVPSAPAETQQAVWTVVKAGTDAGVIVVGAAGNGDGSTVGEDLDSATYDTYRGWGDSGAIIVGAGTSDTNHDKMLFSTFGDRVNVQAWGQNVVTLGYGDLASYDATVNQRYTATFSGTSSATAVVGACCVSVQGLAVGNWGYRLTPLQMRELLMFTGIPQGSGGQIGPLPNVAAAANVLEPPNAWVDFTYGGGNENGSHARPWNTLIEGLSATPSNGLMRIKQGSFNSAWTFSSPIRIGGWAGIARIGGS